MGKSSAPEGHQTRLPWTPEEDAILIQMVEKIGEKRWPLIAAKLPGRTGKGCSHRWRTYLRPDVKHPHLEPFTEWEAAVIVMGQKEHANNWLYIAKLLLPGRSNTAVKNYWHCRLKAGVGLKSNSFLHKGLTLQQLLNDVPATMRTYPIAQPPFPSVAPSKVMAQRIDPKTGLPLPSGPIAAGKGSGSFTLSVAQVGKPMTGPPPGLEGTDLKAAASQYVAQHLASLGAGASEAATADAKGTGMGRFGSEEIPLIPASMGGVTGGDDDSALSGGASMAAALAPEHAQQLAVMGATGGPLGFGGLPAATLLPDGAVAVPLGDMPMFGIPGGPCGWPGAALPLPLAAVASAGSPAISSGAVGGDGMGRGGQKGSCDGDEERMSDDLEGMLHVMTEEDEEVAAIGDLAADDDARPLGASTGGAATAVALLEGSTAAAAAALNGAAGGGPRHDSFSSQGTPVGSPHHIPHAAGGTAAAAHHHPSPLGRAGAVSPFAAFQDAAVSPFGGPEDATAGGLLPFGQHGGSCVASDAAPICGVAHAAAAGRWDSSISSSCQQPLGHHLAAHGGLRHLLPARAASASALLGGRAESWEDEVRAVGSPHQSQQQHDGIQHHHQQEQQQHAAEWDRTWQQEQQHMAAAHSHQQQQDPQQQQHGAVPPVGRIYSSPGALDRMVVHAAGAAAAAARCDDFSPQQHLRLRLAGVAAAAAQQAEDAANGGTPVAGAHPSPSVDGLDGLALGTPTAAGGGAPHMAAAAATAAVPAAGGTFGSRMARAPSGGLGIFSRQESLGVQDLMPFEWEAFGRATSMMPRPSNDDSGAFEALLAPKGF